VRQAGKTRVSPKGQIVLPANQGLVEWLLSCPEKGYFEPVESESTDSLCLASWPPATSRTSGKPPCEL
jgi:hypothetical protein